MEKYWVLTLKEKEKRGGKIAVTAAHCSSSPPSSLSLSRVHELVCEAWQFVIEIPAVAGGKAALGFLSRLSPCSVPTTSEALEEDGKNRKRVKVVPGVPQGKSESRRSFRRG